VRAAQEAIDSREFAYWMAYERLFPFNHTDQLLARTLTLLLNVYRDEKKRRQPYRVEDVMPDPMRSRLTPQEEQRAIADTRRRLMETYMARKERAN
jgi:hypothetical protein